jgi:hypothetical protein
MAEHTISVIHGDRATKVPNATAKGDQLWLSAGDLAQVAGWVLKPEGFCRGELCVPVPAARRGELVSGDSYNLAALASMLGQPVIHDAEHAVWSIGEASSERKRSLTALEAPDFSLPDLNGTQHSLREQRGKKVLLVSWASW